LKTIFKARQTESDLIQGCKDGSQASMEKLYKLYIGRMKGLAYRYARTTFDLDDIIQEGFIRIFQNINSFNNQGSFEGWCKRIIINTAINYYKKFIKTDAEVHYDFVDEGELEAVEIADHLEVDELHALINQLPEKYRLIINLFAIDGYSHKEIAQMMHMEESTSSSQYSRAKKHLITLIHQNS
jgi:RNA polymerase sigma factor (sigma-70 family)